MAGTQNTKTNTKAAADAPPITAKNFRHNNDVEEFYRFVNDNKLQREARLALGRVHLALKKKTKSKRGRKKLQ